MLEMFGRIWRIYPDLQKVIINKTDARLRQIETSCAAEGRFLSFCQPDGYCDDMSAVRFHELLGLPPLETNLIYQIDYLALDLIKVIVQRASRFRPSDKNAPIELEHYNCAINSTSDLLFGIPFEMDIPQVEINKATRQINRTNSMFMDDGDDLRTMDMFYEMRALEQKQLSAFNAAVVTDSDDKDSDEDHADDFDYYAILILRPYYRLVHNEWRAR
ncbi:unnamed protein product [Caenorhabditis bovis]|nr:unnamed protein product [Caenorhabditis bovis]